MKKVDFKKGVLHIDGKPKFLLSADYPYYRDNKSKWPSQLENLKRMGIDTVTCYVPWRHHSLKPFEYDFRGLRANNTDIISFINLCGEKQLFLILKPGPFIHAETDFGGFPNYVSASLKDIEPLESADGKKTVWNKPFPSPLGKNYLKHLKSWMNAVDRNVISANIYPKGPIVALQILNEGIYTNGGDDLSAYDYSESAQSIFKEYLKKKYKSIASLNKKYNTKHSSFKSISAPRVFNPKNRQGLDLYLDWASFSSFYYRTVIEEYIGYLGLSAKKLPVYINLNLCRERESSEIYALRNNPNNIKDLVKWGYTNWAGTLAENEEPLRKYRITTGMSKGVCMEENWGFSKLYNPLYRFVQPSYYQTIYYTALGATGFNVYTGVSTDGWDKNLDTHHTPPYPASSPITANGDYRDSFYTIRQLSDYFSSEGSDLCMSEKSAGTAWLIYNPYLEAGSWMKSTETWEKLGFSQKPENIHNGLDTFQKAFSYLGVENDVRYISSTSLKDIERYKLICFKSSDWIDLKTFKKLENYVKKGGNLIWAGPVPSLNEKFESTKEYSRLFPFQTKTLNPNGSIEIKSDFGRISTMTEKKVLVLNSSLKNDVISAIETDSGEKEAAFSYKFGKGRIFYFGYDIWDITKSEKTALVLENIMNKYINFNFLYHITHDERGKLDVLQRNNAKYGRQFIFVINRRLESRDCKIFFENLKGKKETFSVFLAGYSSCIAGFQNSKIVSLYIKGINDEKGIRTAPKLVYKNKIITAPRACDYMVVDKPGINMVSIL